MNRVLNSGLVVTTVVTLLATSSTRATLAAPTSKTPTPQQASNARDFYQRAGEALNRDHKGFDFPPFGNNEKNATSPASWKIRKATLARNARALSLMRQGFAFPYSRRPYQSQWDLMGNDGLPFNFDMRELARLLMVESDVFVHRGEYSKAINNGLDAVRLSKDIAQGGVIDLLIGNAISSLGKSRIKRSVINKLSAVKARAAARRLENIEMRNVSYADVVREEKRFGQIMLRDVLKENKWRAEYPTVKTPQQIMMTYNRVMDEAIINVSRPFPQRKTKLQAADDPLNEMLTGSYTSGALTTGSFQARDNTTSQMLMTMLALRAFRVERGAYPNTLDELVPNYLRRVPLDSFSNQPLRYVKKNNEYSLYSIGYDMIDDGGKPLPQRAKPDAKGDIVAGINVG